MDKQTETNLLERLQLLPPELIAGFPIGLESTQLVGGFFKCALRSEFQTTYFEGADATWAKLSVTGPNGSELHEDKLFSLATGEEGVLRLDRMVRLLHALNHFIVRDSQDQLLMSVHSLLLTYVKDGHGKPFARLLRHFDLDPRRIVLVLPDEMHHTATGLCALAAYRAQGFGVCARQALGWNTNLLPGLATYESEAHLLGRHWDNEASFQHI